MDVRIISLGNETGSHRSYEVSSGEILNGSFSGRIVETATVHDGGPSAGQLVLALLLSFFVLVALAGNLLVIVAVVTDRNLRRTSNYFIVSLALADALVAAAVMTFAAANDVMGRWAFGPRTCRVWLSADVMCSTASILNLCAISLDRYIHVRSPLHYDHLVTHGRSLAAIAVLWIMSALISFLPIHLGWHRVTEISSPAVNSSTNLSTLSQLHWTGEVAQNDVVNHDAVGVEGQNGTCILELNPLYAILSSTISFYLPCMAMLCIYYRLHRYARRQVESIKMTYNYMPTAPVGGASQGADVVDADDVEDGGPLRYKMSDHKAAITLGIIMGVFLLSWSPFFTVNLVGALCGPGCVPQLVFAVFTWLGYVNSTMNPIIYSIFNREFRDAFRRVLRDARRRVSCCRCCCGDGVPAGGGRAKYGAVRTMASTTAAGADFTTSLVGVEAVRTRQLPTAVLNATNSLRQISTSI